METKTLPMIAGVTITTDSEGRFNLSALAQAAKAQGIKKDVRVNEWLSLQSTREMEQILITENPAFKPILSNAGRYGGTFVHELLAVSYAGWISPSFQLKVNQVFLDYKNGKLQPVAPVAPKKLSRMEILNLAMEAEQENTELKTQIAQDRPKVEFYEQVTETDQEVSVRDAAKMLGTGEKRLFTFLREYGYLMTREPDRNLPYQRYIDQDFFTVRLKSFEHPKEGKKTYRKAFITGKGLVRLAKHLREIEVRQKLDQHLGLIA